jgi:hypothetical protein
MHGPSLPVFNLGTPRCVRVMIGVYIYVMNMYPSGVPGARRAFH